MMLDVAGALAVAAIVGPGRPSLDDLLRAAFPRGPGARAATQNLARGRYDDMVPLLVRLGLAAHSWRPASWTSWSSTTRRWPPSTHTA